MIGRLIRGHVLYVMFVCIFSSAISSIIIDLFPFTHVDVRSKMLDII